MSLETEIDLDASMMETLREMEASEENNDGHEQPAETAGDDHQSLPGDAGNERDDSGTEGAAGDAAPAGGTEGQQTQAEPEEELEPDLQLPPTSWKPEAREKYRDLPAWAKKQAWDREKEMQAGVENLKQLSAFGQQLDKTITPYRAYLNSKGIAPEAAVQSALNLAYSLDTATPQGKAQILQAVARQYGVDLTALKPEDPEQQRSQQILSPVLQELNQLKQTIFGQQQHEQLRQRQAVESEIQAFATEVGADGKAKRPFFERVRDQMSALIEAGRATTLEAAYDQAVWADPDTRSLMLAAQQKDQETKRQQEQQAKAEKARQANKLNVQKRGLPEGSATKPTGSLEDTLKETYAALQSR